MIDPFTASLVIGAVQTGVGSVQRIAAERRRKNALAGFNYEIPSATKEILQNSRERASQSGLPGEETYRAQQQAEMARVASKGERVSDSISDVLGLYSKLYQTQTDTNRQLLTQGAEMKDMRERELNQSLGLMAQAQGEQFYYNRVMPLMNELGYATEQAQGGAANIQGGLQTAYGAYLNKFMMDEMSGMYGNQNPQGRDSIQDILGRRQFTNRLRREYGTPATEAPLQVEPWMKNF